MTLYRDIETDELLTVEELQAEYTDLYFSGGTEAETFQDYLKNCLEGTLEKVEE